MRDPTDLPDLLDILDSDRRRKHGPPDDPRLAAYEQVLGVARRMLYWETGPRRRRAILKEFDRQVARIESIYSGHKTWLAQLTAIEPHWGTLNFPSLDLRKRRTPRGPTDLELLAEYGSELPRIQRIFGETRDDRRRRVQRLRVRYRHLPELEAGAAASQSPSRATHVVLGARYHLSPARIRDRCSAARRGTRI